MKYYQDITLLPDAEANLGFLWHKAYQQIHLALVENKIAENQSAIAIAFPDYDSKEYPLGDRLRLFSGAQCNLVQLNINQWLSRLTDYTHVKSIKFVPETVKQHACFRRKQFKSNLLKEAVRRAKYKNEPLGDALAHFEHYEKDTSLPYINMMSLSMNNENNTSRNFKLFIEQEVFQQPQFGMFNCYGLSKTATVPWF